LFVCLFCFVFLFPDWSLFLSFPVCRFLSFNDVDRSISSPQ
jgi:hypothetical protein